MQSQICFQMLDDKIAGQQSTTILQVPMSIFNLFMGIFQSYIRKTKLYVGTYNLIASKCK